MIETPTRPAPGPSAGPIVFLGAAGLFFALLLGGAFAWDSSRGLSSAFETAESADREMRAQEERFMIALPAIGAAGPAIETAVGKYRAATERGARGARHAAFREVLASVGALPATDPTDPVARRAADEYAGAQNRWQIALRNYQAAAADYNKLARGMRGQVGRAISGLPERLPE